MRLRVRVALIMLAVCLLLPIVSAGDRKSRSRSISGTSFSFRDDYLIDRIEGVHLQLNSPGSAAGSSALTDPGKERELEPHHQSKTVTAIECTIWGAALPIT